MPRSMLSFITAQRSSNPERTSSGLRNASSLARIISAMRFFDALPYASSSAALAKG